MVVSFDFSGVVFNIILILAWLSISTLGNTKTYISVHNYLFLFNDARSDSHALFVRYYTDIISDDGFRPNIMVFLGRT